MNKIADIEEAKKKFVIGSKWYDEEGYVWKVINHYREFISLQLDDYFIMLFEGSTDDFTRCDDA